MKTIFFALSAFFLVALTHSGRAEAQNSSAVSGWHYYANCHSDSYFGGWDIKVYTDNASGKIRASLERFKGPDGDGDVISFAFVNGQTLGFQVEPRSIQFSLNTLPKRYISISFDRVLDGLHRGAIDTIYADGSKDAEQLLCSMH